MTDESGLRATNNEYMQNSIEYWEMMSAAAGKVTPLLIPPRSEQGYAWNAAVVELCSRGLIPRTCGLVIHSEGMPLEAILSSLKDTGLLISETFSVMSHGATRTSLLYSCSKTTDGSPKERPDTPTTPPDT